jgi:orotidine-5'-phosphate decarboxylase
MAKVFVALDFPSEEQAWQMAEKLHPQNPFFKVGLELFVATGPSFVHRLTAAGAEVFLDLKFHDIPNTVAGAIRSSMALGARYVNGHCGGGEAMIRAAVEAARKEAERLGVQMPTLLGVTVLTSLDDQAVQQIGFPRSASAQVKHFVELAQDCGLDGVVCSAEEISLVKSLAGRSFLTMVPGIRPAGAEKGDQKRTLTPAEAVAAGADCLVVGRPVTGAADPRLALSQILQEVAHS